MRPNLGAPLQTGGVQQGVLGGIHTGGVQPGVQITTQTVHVKETVKVDDYHHEETDFYYTKERLNYINLIRNLGFLAIVVAIASIVLAIIHLVAVPLDFVKILLAAAILFLIGAILAVYWATKAAKTFRASNDLFQPQLKEDLSRTVFIGGLLLAGIAAFVVTHLYVEFEYSPDYTNAQHTTNGTWDDAYPGRTQEGLDSYLRKNFIIQSCFAGFFFFYFLLTARAAFSCLKFGNQAMSHLVFFGNFLLLIFALCVIYFADNAFEYAEFPQLRAHFPVWNIRGLSFVGIALTAVAVTGFLVDHKSWRVGFFVLAFILLVLMVLLATFTGFAYRHTRQTYEYYKGIDGQSACLSRMGLVHSNELEDYGCPTKYVAADACPATEWVTKWEQTSADTTQEPARREDTNPTAARTPETDQATTTTTTTTPADEGAATTTTTTTPADEGAATTTTTTTPADDGAATTTTTTPADDGAATTTTTTPDDGTTTTTTTPDDGTATTTTTMLISDDFGGKVMFAQETTVPSYCLNSRCCGLQGQLYSRHLTQLSAFGLLATLAAALVSIGCYYFWYVTWVDTARDKRRDFVWLGLMGLSILVFIILFFAVDRNYISERTGSGPRQLESLIRGW